MGNTLPTCGGISGASAPASLKHVRARPVSRKPGWYFRGIRPGLIEAWSHSGHVSPSPTGISGASAPASLKRHAGAQAIGSCRGISGASAPASLKLAGRRRYPLGRRRYFRGIRPGLIEAFGAWPWPFWRPGISGASAPASLKHDAHKLAGRKLQIGISGASAPASLKLDSATDKPER